MPTFDREWLLSTILLLPPLLFSITVHEFAHARTALAFGDATAKLMGRVSLNPLRHLDPLGTLALIFTRLIGWAKPVPVNPYNVRHQPWGDLAISIAGPLSNLSLAVIFGAGYKLWLHFGVQAAMSGHELGNVYEQAGKVLVYTTICNVGLCVFNLIPLYPLDGHHIMADLLPQRMRPEFMDWQLRFGRIVFFALIFGPALMKSFIPGWSLDPIAWLQSFTMDLFLHAMQII